MEHVEQPLRKKIEKKEEIRFFDLFDKDEIQKLQDLFSAVNKVSSVIMDLDGNMLTRPSSFTPLCKLILEKTPKGSPACFADDQFNKEERFE